MFLMIHKNNQINKQMGKKRQLFLLEEFQIIYVIDLALQDVEFNSPCALNLDALNDFFPKNRVWKDGGKVTLQ